jgi:hypothetical protein
VAKEARAAANARTISVKDSAKLPETPASAGVSDFERI